MVAQLDRPGIIPVGGTSGNLKASLAARMSLASGTVRSEGLRGPGREAPGQRPCAGQTGESAGMAASKDEIFAGLRKIDTPTVTNVVATYPKNPLCLGLYNPWTENWYTDSSIRCIYPEMGPVIGHAVTCVYGLPDPNYSGRLSFMDVIDALDAMPKPTILIIQQKWPPELMAKAGLAGEIMVTSMRSVGCIGMLSNGPSRDVDAIRKLGFQLLLGGVTAGHGEMAVQAVNVPVSVGGMDVAPGELIHMDENGAVKFPADRAGQVLENAEKMLAGEAEHLARLRSAKTAAEVRAAGGAYSAKPKG
jgi:4-hydroxy-4-methyl-2-oxoglutarate aldolase